MIRLISFILISMMLFACSPKLNKRDFSSPLMDLKPNLDENHNFSKLEQNAKNFKISWNGVVKTSEVHDVISDLIELGASTKNENLKLMALKLYKKLYQEKIAIKTQFTETPYMIYFQQLSTSEVKDSLKELNNTLDKNLSDIKLALLKVKLNIKWPIQSKYEDSMKLLALFLDNFLSEIDTLNLSKLVEEELKKQIVEEKEMNLKILNSQLVKIHSEESLENMLNIIETMIKEFEIVLDQSTVEKLKIGKGLSSGIQNINNDITAFKTIIEVWKIFDETERNTYIKPISKSLFNYLNGKKPDELNCLSEEKCPGLVSGLIRDWAVLRQINNFGIDKIKDILNKKTHEYALNILEENILKTIKELDKKLYNRVKKSILNGKSEISRINKNTKGFINEKVEKWLRNNFDTGNSSINAYEFENVKVQIHKGEVNISFGVTENNKINSRTIGTSFRTSSLLWVNNLMLEKEFKRNVLEQINKIMGFGGLPSNEGPTKGIVTDFDGNDQAYDVNNSLKSIVTFGLTDHLQLISPYLIKEKKDPVINVSASNQASLIYGLVYLMEYFKDWKENNFDNLLGNIKSNDIFESEANPEKDKNIFPKVQFFGLVVAQLANIISNLNKQFSQMALMTNEVEKIWINEFIKNKDKNVLYGVYVDIINGNRGEEVSIESMYHLVLALKKLLYSSIGIEKTKFSELQKKDLTSQECKNPRSVDCKSYAQLMADNIHELKKIFLPIGNTISSKFRRSSDQEGAGAVFGKISTKDLKPISTEYALEDQMMAIETLVYIFEITELETYLWSAKETFNFLQKYYNPKTNFFDLGSKEITLPKLIRTLKAFKAIYKYLDEKEQIILAEKFKVWEFAIEKLN